MFTLPTGQWVREICYSLSANPEIDFSPSMCNVEENTKNFLYNSADQTCSFPCTAKNSYKFPLKACDSNARPFCDKYA